MSEGDARCFFFCDLFAHNFCDSDSCTQESLAASERHDMHPIRCCTRDEGVNKSINTGRLVHPTMSGTV